MDELLLSLYLDEVRPALVGARIEKALQYGGFDLALRVWLRPGRETLVLSADPQAPILALIPDEPPEPRERSSLLEAVRSRLVPSTIEALEKLPGDRIVVLHAAGHRLVAELVPRAPALLLLEASGRIVAACGPGLPGKRGLRAGTTWEPPPAPPPLGGALGGLTRRVAREVEARAAAASQTLAAARAAFEEETRRAPRPTLHVLSDGSRYPAPCPFVTLPAERTPFPTLRALVSSAYTSGVAGVREESLRARLRAALAKRRERLARTRSRVAAEAAKAHQADGDRAAGELLLAFQSMARLETTRSGLVARVPDLADASRTVDVPLLEPRASLVENANAYFARYRQRKRALIGTEKRLASLALEVTHLEELDAAVMVALPGELPSLEDELREEGLVDRGSAPRTAPRGQRARSSKTPAALVPREFRASDGTTVLVGRSSRGNDRLTFELARDEDFWLHADAPGSHVVLRNPARTEEPEPAALAEAATLAAWFSSVRSSSKVEVRWTARRQVRRVPGGPPGAVLLRSHRSIAVDPRAAARTFGLELGPGLPEEA